jgi:AraC-like DNA-binding protein
VAYRFDVGDLAPSDRAGAIREISRALNGRIEVDLPANPARIEAVTTGSMLGSVDMSAIQWNVLALRRSVGRFADDVEPHVCVAVQKSGISRFVQGGRQTEIRPGDLVVLENTKPYTVSFHGTVRSLVVRVPAQTLALPSSVLGRITAVRLGSDRPVVDAAAAFFSRLVRHQAAVGETDAGVLEHSCTELVRAVLTSSAGREDLAREPLHHTLAQRVATYVRLHLAEPDLTAARIAAEHHVSVRQLYLTLAKDGVSLGGLIRALRLEECRRRLESPACRFMTIEAIARQWGFASAAHFSRVFKSAYGTSPRDWRAGDRDRRSDAVADPWRCDPGAGSGCEL